MNLDLIRELRGLSISLSLLDDLILETTCRRHDTGIFLILFKECLLIVQSLLGCVRSLLLALLLNLYQQILQRLLSIGIGHHRSLAIHLVTDGAEENFLINVSIHILERMAHIHTECVAIALLGRNERIFLDGSHIRGLSRDNCGFRSATAGNKRAHSRDR